MSFTVSFPLQTSPAHAERLQALQKLFADACNLLAPIVLEHRCWNRVTLHHLAYRELRNVFPQLGSQMACNAIYSACRAARIVYQHPNSPWCIERGHPSRLPLLNFMPSAPVYFDRHTLSIKDDRLSLFTLDGRMHFRLDLSDEILARFRSEKLREISLQHNGASYQLSFVLGGVPTESTDWWELPEYLLIDASCVAPLVPEKIIDNAALLA